MTGGLKNWRYGVDSDDWMRFMEKRLMHEERRPTPPVGRTFVDGLAKYAHQTYDWNEDRVTANGYFYSVANMVQNSPDNTKNWIGVTEGAEDGHGVQTVWSSATASPQVTPAVQYQRQFWAAPGGTIQFGTWQQVGGGSGGGGGSPTGPAGGSLTGTYPNPGIANDAVGAAQIATGAVGNSELAANSVDSSKIQDGTITTADLAFTIPPPPTTLPPSGPAGGSLTGTYPNPGIANDAVGAAQIAANAVGSSELADGAVDTAAIVDGNVTLAKLAANSVDASKIVDGSVGNAELAANAVDSSKIADGSISATDLSASAVQAMRPDVLDEGVSTVPDIFSIDFVGPGVTVTGSAGLATVTIPGSKVFSADLPALTAGVEVNVVHNLNTFDLDVACRRKTTVAAGGGPATGIELNWRTVDANTVAIYADLAFAANAIRVTVAA